MTIKIIPANHLSADQFDAWSAIQLSQPRLANPFYRPEFTQAVAAEREGVDVAVWERAGEPVGFLPFERTGQRQGRAVGLYINQAQGAIVRPDVEWSPQEVVRAAGLRVLKFDHLAVDQQPFSPYQFVVSPSYLDLSQGFDHYHKARGKSASQYITRVLQKDRMTIRELGDLRVEINHPDAFAKLLEWKIDQSRRTHIPCVFDIDWVMRLHERLLHTETEHFSGPMFSLHVGDRMIAGFFCLKSGNVLQGSILGYDRELSRFAPGLVLLMRVAKLAPSMGFTRIEMSSGGESYKEKVGSHNDQVSEAAVTSTPLLQPIYRGLYRVKNRLRATGLRAPVRAMRALMLRAKVQLSIAD
jgi:CelD/BcsL family acetyltransferase involved in cellulose biosynthesis